ncbi:MAG: zf-HC2 domain-containing protein [Thermosynechococcaceae cyanobacterium]
MDNLHPLISDRFELLSAYLDGEVSPAERQQVEAWLASDPEIQRTYRSLLALQDQWRSLPSPAASMPTEQLVDQVMTRLDRRSRLWVWGGLGTAAALVVGAFSGLLTGNPNGTMQMAQQSPNLGQNPSISATLPQPKPPTLLATRPEGADPSALMLALDRPPVAIPVVSTSTDSRSIAPESSF